MNGSMPIIKTSNGGKGFLIFIIIVLSICCLGLGGFILYERLFQKENIIPVKETSAALEQVKLDGGGLLEVEDIINSFEYAYNDSFSNYFGYIYSGNLIKASNFDEQAALFACLYPYLDESNNVSYVANNTVKHKYKTIFGNKTYNPKNISAGSGYDIKYDSSTKYYSYQRLGAGGYFYPTYVAFNDSSVISSDRIEVTKRVAYLEYNGDHTIIDVYSDGKKSKKLGILSVKEGSFSPVELREKFNSSLSQYKYIFVKSDNSFVFDSIVRTK